MRHLLREARRRTVRGEFSAVERSALVAAMLVVGLTLIADLWIGIDYRLAANISLLCIAVLVNTFTLFYFVRSPWWTNRIGRIYLAKCLVLSLVLDQIAVTLWWDMDYPYRQQIRFAIYTLGAIVYVPMLVSLLRLQRADREAQVSA